MNNKNDLWRNDDSKSQLWHTFYWSGWNEMIYSEYITEDDIQGQGAPQNYHEVFSFDPETGEPTAHPVTPIDLQKIVFVRKNGQNFMLPVRFEEEFPLKVTNGFECLAKKSDKTVFKFVKGVKTIKVPADNRGRTFRQRVDSFNPIKHTNQKHLTLMKLLAFASAYSGVGVGICSPPEFMKGVFFNLLKYMGTNTAFLKAPTEAYLYQSVCINKVLVFDEITTAPSEKVTLIENLVIGLKDNTPELPKQALTRGFQKKSADLTKISAVFTFNRPKDLRRGKPFEEVWGNPAAIKSRFPLFLFDGKVDQSFDNPSPHQLEKAIKEESDFFKGEMMETQYWVENLHEAFEHKKWDRNVLTLKGRHYTNAKAWVDTIEAYCETADEFREMLVELNKCKENYDRMVKGLEPIESVNVETFKDNSMPKKEPMKVSKFKYNSNQKSLEQVEEEIL